jgi:3-methyladenine DNA glycosylase AlkD
MSTCDEVMARFRGLRNDEKRAGMARFGINTETAYGISIYELRPIAKEIGTDHYLAQELWASGVHEARILASYVEDPSQVTEEQMERWVADFDSWDLCDQVCGMFEQTSHARRKVVEWSERDEEFVKRAAFAIVAGLAVHDKQAPDSDFEAFFPLIVAQSTDGRNFVKKAVSWALRNIGKRDLHLNQRALEVASRLKESCDRTARWIGFDAYRELSSEKVRARLERHTSRR